MPACGDRGISPGCSSTAGPPCRRWRSTSGTSRAWAPKGTHGGCSFGRTPPGRGTTRTQDRPSTAIGAPWLYLARMLRPTLPPHDPAASPLVIPMHGTHVARLDADPAAMARFYRDSLGPSTICLHVEDLGHRDLVAAWSLPGNEIVSAGSRFDPLFLVRLLTGMAAAGRGRQQPAPDRGLVRHRHRGAGERPWAGPADPWGVRGCSRAAARHLARGPRRGGAAGPDRPPDRRRARRPTSPTRRAGPRPCRMGTPRCPRARSPTTGPPRRSTRRSGCSGSAAIGRLGTGTFRRGRRASPGRLPQAPAEPSAPAPAMARLGRPSGRLGQTRSMRNHVESSSGCAGSRWYVKP